MNPDRAPVRIMSVILPPFDLEEAPVSNLPSKREKLQIEKLIAKLEERAGKKPV